MELTSQQLYDWLEMAIAMGKPTCDKHKRTVLELVYITDDMDNLITWWVCCPTCKTEYQLLVGWKRQEQKGVDCPDAA